MKTIIEAAVENRNSEIKPGNQNDSMFNSRLGMQILLDKTFANGAEFAQQFIPIEQELPKPHEKILVIDSISKSESYGQFSQNMEWFHCHKSTNVFAKSDIVSWRPIRFL